MIATHTFVEIPRCPFSPHRSSGTLHGMPVRPMPTPPPPAMTIGKYQLYRKIGEGAMGSIWLARDFITGRNNVLKLALPGLELFLEEEGKILSQLAHKNIVTFVENMKTNGISYLAMEYIPGKTVAALIKDRELDFPKLLEIIMQVCYGLNHLQEKGYVHCDLKPNNIMVQPDGTVKIIDFGLSMPAHENAVAGVGTMRYRAPEQENGDIIDVRTDIYALGVTFNDALTFLYYQDRISKVACEALSPIIQKMTASRPEDRYQHPLDVVADIKKLQID